MNPMAQAWLGALWPASWQGGIGLLVVWGVCRFIQRIPPGFKVWLWRLAWAKFLLALFWSGSIRLQLLPPAHREAVLVVESRANPVAIERSASAPTTSAEPSPDWRSGLMLLWMVGVLGCATRLGVQWLGSQRLVRRAEPIDDDREYRQLAESMGIRRPPQLRQSSAVLTPALVGTFRPIILLPPSLANGNLACARLRMMLAHELAHWKRRDLLWGWLATACELLFFFHPLIWLTRREWLLAREMACDELALRHVNASPVEYGNMLIDVIAARPSFGALSICETNQDLKRRIQAMKNIGVKKNVLLASAVLFGVCSAVLPLRIVAQDAPEDSAARIKRLEEENAKLREQLQRNESQGSKASVRAAELDAARTQLAAAQAELANLQRRFVDNHPKVKVAQHQVVELQEILRRLNALEADGAKARANRAARQREMYEQELKLTQEYADSVRKLYEKGRATHDEYVRVQKELFSLKREIANLEADRGELKELMHQEIEIVNKMLKETRKLIEQGLLPAGRDLSLQRELIKLKRELLLLE